MRVDDLPERLRQKVVVDAETDCWMWQGSRDDLGYGQTKWQGRSCRVHRLTYELLVGPIPVGLVIDHLCCNKPCVYPAHLEPVTDAENRHRYTQTITHCPQGHPYDSANTYLHPDGRKRKCRTCARARWRRRRAVLAGRVLVENEETGT